MGKASLSTDEACAMFLHVAERLMGAKEQLTQADKAIGDGDHGIGMARGFEAVQRQLHGQTYATVDELLKTVGTTLLSNVGGASGA
ncbi:MAG: DAK2 domain-containing protein, partial [Gemmataceae bacterium]